MRNAPNIRVCNRGYKSLGKYATVFQAEIVAIMECVRCIKEELDAAKEDDSNWRSARGGRRPSETATTSRGTSSIREHTIVRENRNKRIAICTDRQAIIKALGGYAYVSRTALECRQALDEIARRVETVRVCWVSGHAGIEGNERADRFAKEGASRAPNDDETVPR